ncbi:MAG TPA: hypothetical protein VGI40_06510 [Pirellulaceae bacterium]|jgi:hypothetical protein
MLNLLVLDVRYTKRNAGHEHGATKNATSREDLAQKTRISNAAKANNAAV